MSIGTYRKRTTVRAVQFDGINWDEIRSFTGGNFRRLARPIENGFIAEVYDYLHDTWVKVKLGMWILEGTEGEFYPHEEAAFGQNYERIRGESS